MLAKKKPTRSFPPPEASLPTLRSATEKLLLECKHTIEEISEILQEDYSHRSGSSPAGVEHFRRMYNVQAVMLNKDMIPRLVRNDEGELVDLEKCPPLSQRNQTTKYTGLKAKRKTK